jgi:hypothetical protein
LQAVFSPVPVTQPCMLLYRSFLEWNIHGRFITLFHDSRVEPDRAIMPTLDVGAPFIERKLILSLRSNSTILTSRMSDDPRPPVNILPRFFCLGSSCIVHTVRGPVIPISYILIDSGSRAAWLPTQELSPYVNGFQSCNSL